MRVLLRVQSEPLIALGELFETRIVPGRPSWVNVGFSVAFHCAAAACLATIHFPSDSPGRIERQFPATEIKIGSKLYSFARLAPPDRKLLVGRSKDAQAGRERLTREKSPRGEARPPGARPFIPPEVRRETIASQTLIQPLSPPEIQLPELTLPSFRAWTAQIPKIPKPFVAPGREATVVPDAQPLLSLPNLNLVSANSVPPKTNATLTIPLPPPPLEIPEIASDMPQGAPPGDPVNMLAITGNPVLPAAKLVVPAGNAVGLGGSDPTGRFSNSNGSGSDAAGMGAGAGKGTGVSGSGADAASRPGDGTAGGASVKTVVIARPAGGSFDAIVVQSSALDLFPGRKDLLSGRPIYTVYLALGTAKDWTFYFCIPQDPSVRSAPSSVITLDSGPPVAAPYPLRMIRPLVSMPSYQKYLLVHGFVTDSGRVERLRIIDPGLQQVDDAILSSLIGWQFRPATRDGEPTPVEFLLAIPQAGLGL